MKKIDLFYGFLLGLLTTFIGTFLFVKFFTDYDFVSALKGMKQQGKLGKLITLGAILNVATYLILIKFNKELIARGVVLAVIILTIITLLL